MNTEEIQNFLKKHKVSKNDPLKISFKKRNTMQGIFIDCKDAADLQAKNFWRIVSGAHVEEWKKTKDINLSRLYSGSDFSKLAVDQSAS